MPIHHNIKLLVLLFNKLIDDNNHLTIEQTREIILNGDVIKSICSKFDYDYEQFFSFIPNSLTMFDKEFLVLWEEYGEQNKSLGLSNGLALLLSFCVDFNLEKE